MLLHAVQRKSYGAHTGLATLAFSYLVQAIVSECGAEIMFGVTMSSLWLVVLQNKPHKLTKSMFPNADSPPLERCMRILPHHSDTGGFFIAVLEKVGKFPKPVPK